MGNYKEKIFLYHQGLLSATEIKQVEQHLSSCNECAKRFSQLKNINNLMQSIPTPTGDKEKMREKLFGTTQPLIFRLRKLLLKPSLAISFILLLFTGLFMLNTLSQEKRAFKTPLKKIVYNEVINQINNSLAFNLSAVSVNFLGQNISFRDKISNSSNKTDYNSKKRKIIFNIIYKNINHLIKEALTIDKDFASVWEKSSLIEKNIIKQKILNSEYSKYMAYFECSKIKKQATI